MNILAIDTTNTIFSAAILKDNKLLSKSVEHRQHTAVMLNTIDEIFKQSGISYSDIDVYGVNVGPGSFTGIRIGISTAETFARCFNKPLIGIDSLSVLSYNVNSECICALINARNNRAFSCIWKNSEYVVQPGIYDVAQIAAICRKYNASITGSVNDFRSFLSSDLNCIESISDAATICKIISEMNPDELGNKIIAEPVYLKKSEPEEKAHV